MSAHRYVGVLAAVVAFGALTALAESSPRRDASAAPGLRRQTPTGPSSADVLALLPDGEEKRRFVLDCTGCHQFDARAAYPNGTARTRAEWDSVVTRMLRYAGATTRFPVISAARNSRATCLTTSPSMRAAA